MGSFESKQLSPKEQIRAQKKEITRAIHEIDKAIRECDTRQTLLTNQIKEAARKARGKDDPALRTKSKDFVRNKKTSERYYMLRTHLQGVQIQIQTMQSTEALSTAMKGTVKIMTTMNKKLQNSQLAGIMQKFSMEMDHMTDTQDLIGEGLDDAMSSADDETEENAIVDQVMAELKLESMAQARNIPTTGPGVLNANSTTTTTGTNLRAAVPMGPGPQQPPPTLPPPANNNNTNNNNTNNGGDGGGGGGGDLTTDALAARLANLKK